MLGITFLDEPHPGVRLTRVGRKHCRFMSDALRGGPVQIERRTISCPIARYYLGVDESTIDDAVAHLLASGDVEDEEVARLYMSSGWRMTGKGPYLLYFRYPLQDVEPQVLIRIGTPAELALLVHAYTVRTGGRMMASVSGLGAACGECTVYPLLTGFPNMSLACRHGIDIDEDHLMLAAPRPSRMFDVMVENP